MTTLEIRLAIMKKTVSKWLASGEKLFIKESTALQKKEEEIAKYKKEIADLKAQLKSKPKPKPEEPKPKPEEPQTPDNPGTPDPDTNTPTTPEEPEPEEPEPPKPPVPDKPKPEVPTDSFIDPETGISLMGIITNRRRLVANRKLAYAENGLERRAMNNLLKNAKRLLEQPIEVLTTKKNSSKWRIKIEDPRYLYSCAPYWEPVPGKPDAPWYKPSDSGGNGITEALGDKRKYDNICKNIVPTLILAYFFTDKQSEKDAFAKRAVENITAFFLDAKTGMIPSFRYAQITPGHAPRIEAPLEGEPIGKLLDLLTILKGSKYYTKEFEAGIYKWTGDLLNWLLSSEQGREANAKLVNNIGVIYQQMLLACSLFLGKTDFIKTQIDKKVIPMYVDQIGTDGAFVHELGRDKTWMYSCKTLNAWIDLLRITAQAGHNMWDLEIKGRSFKRAVRFLIPYAMKKKIFDRGESVKLSYALESFRVLQGVYENIDPALSNELEPFLRENDKAFRAGQSEDLLTSPFKKW